jgi:beta-lactamase regulating signal transducer with metallopeptidase domain
MLVLTLVVSLLIGIVAGASGSFGLAAGLFLLDFVAIIAFTAFYYVRFGLAFPLTLLREKIVIGEAWRITRGRFWALFAASLVVLVIIFALWMVVSSITSGAYFAELARSAGNPVAVQKAAQAQMARQFEFSGTAVLLWIVGGIIGALTVTLWGGAAATAAQQLTFNPNEIADTFA